MRWLASLFRKPRLRASTPDLPAWKASTDAKLEQRRARRAAASAAARAGAATKVDERYRRDRLINEARG
jgi:hypothetical protein